MCTLEGCIYTRDVVLTLLKDKSMQTSFGYKVSI